MDSDTRQQMRTRTTDFANQLVVPGFVHKINELANQDLWRRGEEEEKQALQKIADMWEIVQAVAQTSSTYYEFESWSCPFCDGLDSAEDDNVTHEEGCIVAKARKLVRENQPS